LMKALPMPCEDDIEDDTVTDTLDSDIIT